MRFLFAAFSLVSLNAYAACVPAELQFQAQPVPAIANQNMPTAVVINTADAHGNLCADDNTSVVQLAFIPTSPAEGYIRQSNRWLPGNITAPVQVKNGVASFEAMAFSAGGVKRFIAVDAAVKRVLKVATTAPFTVPAFGAPDHLLFVVQPLTGGLRDMAWKQQPAVALVDKFNNVITSDNGTDIYIDVNRPLQGQGHLVGGATKVPTKNGVAQFSGLFLPALYWIPDLGMPGAVLSAREYTLRVPMAYSAVFDQ